MVYKTPPTSTPKEKWVLEGLVTALWNDVMVKGGISMETPTLPGIFTNGNKIEGGARLGLICAHLTEIYNSRSRVSVCLSVCRSVGPSVCLPACLSSTQLNMLMFEN